MSIRRIIALVLSIAFLMPLKAQETGSFSHLVQFDHDDYRFTRNLYYFVPEDYDSSHPYKLVVGFRGGPHSNAGQFRTQLQFLADSIGAIIVCPENSAHFNVQEGLTKQLFKYTVDTVSGVYNIDPNYIYLTGLSYGGRHAVIVAMDTDNGPIPSIRGVIPFATGRNGELEPNYEHIDQFPPACLCIGLNDNPVFQNVSQQIYEDIKNAGGHAKLNQIPNVGHTVAFPTYPEEMMECLRYIDSVQLLTTIVELSSLETMWSIFPNPAKDYLQIEIDENIDIIKMEILNEQGQLVMQLDSHQRKVKLSSFQNKKLWIRIETEQGHSTKIIVLP